MRQLSQLKLDFLREISNVGAGHAAASLSKMTHRQVMMEIISSGLADISELESLVIFRNTETVGALAEIFGDFRGSIHCVMTRATSLDFLDVLARQTSPIKAMDDTGPLLIKETVETLMAAYLKAISDFLCFTVTFSATAIQVSPRESFLNKSLFSKHPELKTIFYSQVDFIAEGNKLSVFFLLALDQGGLGRILNSLPKYDRESS